MLVLQLLLRTPRGEPIDRFATNSSGASSYLTSPVREPHLSQHTGTCVLVSLPRHGKTPARAPPPATCCWRESSVSEKPPDKGGEPLAVLGESREVPQPLLASRRYGARSRRTLSSNPAPGTGCEFEQLGAGVQVAFQFIERDAIDQLGDGDDRAARKFARTARR